jgi:hypothetical protein
MKVMRTSAPELVEPRSSKESDRAAISGSPSPSVGQHLDLERPLLAFVGVDDDVGARLGDGHLHVGHDGGVERERVGHAGERLADHADALGARGHREPHLGEDRDGHPRTPARACSIACERSPMTGSTGTSPVMSRMRWTPGSTCSPTQTTYP